MCKLIAGAHHEIVKRKPWVQLAGRRLEIRRRFGTILRRALDWWGDVIHYSLNAQGQFADQRIDLAGVLGLQPDTGLFVGNVDAENAALQFGVAGFPDYTAVVFPAQAGFKLLLNLVPRVHRSPPRISCTTFTHVSHSPWGFTKPVQSTMGRKEISESARVLPEQKR